MDRDNRSTRDRPSLWSMVLGVVESGTPCREGSLPPAWSWSPDPRDPSDPFPGTRTSTALWAGPDPPVLVLASMDGRVSTAAVFLSSLRRYTGRPWLRLRPVCPGVPERRTTPDLPPPMYRSDDSPKSLATYVPAADPLIEEGWGAPCRGPGKGTVLVLLHRYVKGRALRDPLITRDGSDGTDHFLRQTS